MQVVVVSFRSEIMQSFRDLIEAYEDEKESKKSEDYWEVPDIEAAVKKKDEATTSANVGAYPVPLGGVLRPAYPSILDDYTHVLKRVRKDARK